MKARRIKDVLAPGFQDYKILHGGNGEFVLSARLANGKVMHKIIDEATVQNLRQAHMDTLEERFDGVLKQCYPSIF